MFKYDAASMKPIPAKVFHRMVSLRTITAIIGAIAGFRKNVNEPVVASASFMDLKYA